MKINYSPLWEMLLDEGLSLPKLARLANVTRYSLSQMRAGKPVHIDILAKIANALACDFTELFDITSIQETYQD